VTVIQAGADHDRPDERTAAVAMLTEDYEYVIGGDPDRDTIDLAVLDTATGRTRAHLAAPADGAGYGQMLDWASQHASGRRVWALEGTGSFAAGLADALAEAGEDVVEVGALKRSRGAKPGSTDARIPGGLECMRGWFEDGCGCAGGRIGAAWRPVGGDRRTRAAGRAFPGRLTLARSGLGACAVRQREGQVA
jgi:hypothetical protein